MSDASQTTRPTSEPIAIIGMGALLPGAASLKEYWRLLRRGEDAITAIPPTHWSPEDYLHDDPKQADMVYCARGGFLSPVTFDPLEYGIPPAILEATDTAQLLGLVAGKQALQDAGYGADRDFDRTRASVILGVTGALELVVPLGARLGHPHWRRAMESAGIDAATAQRVVEEISQAYVGWQENSFPGLLGNVVAGRIANRLNLKGTNCVVDAACASSLSAMHLAVLELQAGRSDLVLTGGVDTFNDIFMFMCFARTQALSQRGDARPFDAEADGTVLGEGVGMLVLKRLADAERDGDRICAVLRGVGTSSDGRSQSIYAPRAEGQAIALRDAYTISGVSPATIELVEAHGTGTRVGDVVEFEALKTVFNESAGEAAAVGAKWCAVGSVKAQIGHTKAAAGAASLIKAVLALQQRVILPTIKLSQPNPKLGVEESPFYLPTQARPWLSRASHPRRAAVSSFGFGGSNFHAVLEEYPRRERSPAWDGSVEIVALSAEAPERLREGLAAWASVNSADADEIARRAFASRQAFSRERGYRLALVVERGADVSALARQALEAMEHRDPQSAWCQGNIFFGGPQAPGEVAFLFPGQGSQYVGMGRDLVCVFPEAHEALAAAETRVAGVPLSERVFPPSAFDDATRDEQEAALMRTDVAQPALGAVTLAMLRVLERFGVRAQHVAGHSFGELTALHAAGVIDEATFHEIARLRGELMAAAPGDGAMLAVQAPLEEIEKAIHEEKLDVELTNRNAPAQGILSGIRSQIERAARVLKDVKGWPARVLKVSAAFHSRMMAEVEVRFRAALERLPFEPPRLPIMSNVTGLAYPREPHAIRDLLARQLARPVQFVDDIRHLYDSGVRTFVEVGPKAVLTGLVNNILNGKPFQAISADASCGRASAIADVARVVALFAVLGHAVDLNHWEQAPPPPHDPSMAVQLVGANYRSSRPARAAARILDRFEVERPAREAGVAASTSRSGSGKGSEMVELSLEEGPSMSHTAVRATSPPVHAAAGSNGPVPPSVAAVYAASSAPPTPMAHSSDLGQVFEVVREGLRSMQLLAEQTAIAHQRFLEGQERTAQSFQRLMEHQQRLVEHSLGLSPTTASALPAIPPAPALRANLATPPMVVTPQPTPVPEFRSLDTQTPVPIAATPAQTPPAGNGHGCFPPPQLSSPASVPQASPLLSRTDVADSAPARSPAAAIGDARSAPAEDPGRVLLEVVAELTGYPAEMLKLSMDMEADLGIDSIKRLEILSGVQRRLPNLASVNSQYVGSLRTLQSIVDYMTSPPDTAEGKPPVNSKNGNGRNGNGHVGNGDGQVVRGNAERGADCDPFVSAPALQAEPEQPALRRRVLRAVELPAVSERTFRPSPGGELLITADDTPLAAALADELGRRGVAARVVAQSPDSIASTGERACGLIVLLPAGECDAHRLFAGVKALAGRIATAGAGALLATVARMDGRFLCDAVGTPRSSANQASAVGADGMSDPLVLAGAAAGLVKTVADEWPGVRCVAIDLDRDWRDAASAAARIADELLSDGPIEVGLSAQGRFGLELVDVVAPYGGDLPLKAGDVVVVTGGARGVTAETLLPLARRYRPTLLLLGRSELPAEESAATAEISDETALKRALLQLHSNGHSISPAELQRHYQRLMADREIRRNLARLSLAGATVIYRSVDVRDADAVARMVDEARGAHGPIRGFIHGAGVIEDHRIIDKSPEVFARVFDTKVLGLASLLRATDGDDLAFIAFFSSVSGRFGRRGQVDYAMANEVLNKTAQRLARRRPGRRVVSLNWGPWAGGMVGPALKREFERLGVDLIPFEVGAAAMLKELHATDGAVEVVLGGSLESNPGEAPVGSGALAESARFEPILALACSRRLNLDDHPFLGSHVINGHPVLPVAMMMEWLGHASLHEHPGLRLAGFDGLRVLKGVVLAGNAVTLEVRAGRATRREDGFHVAVELTSDGGRVRHALATALLVDTLPARPVPRAACSVCSDRYPHDRAEIYEQILFHGPMLAGIERVATCGEGGLRADVKTAPPPGEWMEHPLRSTWLADPLVLDAALQLGLLWTHWRFGALSLPARVGTYRQFCEDFPRGNLTVWLIPHHSDERCLAGEIEITDSSGRVVGRLEGVEWIVHPAVRGGREPAHGVPSGT